MTRKCTHILLRLNYEFGNAPLLVCNSLNRRFYLSLLSVFTPEIATLFLRHTAEWVHYIKRPFFNASRSRQLIIFDNLLPCKCFEIAIRVGTGEVLFATLETLRNRTAGIVTTNDEKMSGENVHSRSCATFFLHSDVVSLPAVLLRKVSISVTWHNTIARGINIDILQERSIVCRIFVCFQLNTFFVSTLSDFLHVI